MSYNVFMDNTTPIPQRKRGGCLKVFFIGAAILVIVPLLLICWLAFLFLRPAPPLIVSKETTYITEPLTKDGLVDYLKALELKIYPPEMQTDENGARIFVRLFGSDFWGESSSIPPEDREFYRQQIYQKLDLEPNIEPTFVLPQDPYNILQKFYAEKKERVPKDWGKPWTLEQYPMLADWIREVDEPMDTVAEAIRKPVFFYPILQSPESVQSGRPQCLTGLRSPKWQLIRMIREIFAARATYRIAQGNIDGALDDKLTIHRLGRLFAQQGLLTDLHGGLWFEEMANAIPINGNPGHPLTEPQIHLLLERLDALPAKGSFTKNHIECERFFILSFLQELPHFKKQIDPVNQMYWNAPVRIDRILFESSLFSVVDRLSNVPSFDWNIVHRRVNEVFDVMQEPPPRTQYHSLIRAADKRSITELFLAAVPGGVEHIASNILISLSDPIIEKYEEVIEQHECAQNMHRLSLAMLLYKQKQGTMPDANWAEQIMPYLGDNPEQYFSCPSHLSPKGTTPYCLVKYDELPKDLNTLLLFECPKAVPFVKAVITPEEVLTYFQSKDTTAPHGRNMNCVHQSGAVQTISDYESEERVLPLLGRGE
jgi:hypothetical protein